MNGSKFRAVIDTNVLFMALYDKDSKAGRIIGLANEDKIELFSPISVKEELIRVLKKEMEFSEKETNFIIESLPVNWIEEGVYRGFLDKTKVKHKSDKPVEALSLVLNCEILSADKHFKKSIDINGLLKKLTK